MKRKFRLLLLVPLKSGMWGYEVIRLSNNFLSDSDYPFETGPMDFNVHTTIGSLLAGCAVAVGLSAILGFQTFLYFHIFPSDAIRYKLLVAWIWFIDAVHTALICTTVWLYAVDNFSNPGIVTRIFPTVALSVAMTATTALSVNTFYAWRIHKLSRRNWLLTGSIGLLCTTRIAMALVLATEMIITKTFPEFAKGFKLWFTAGLLLSAFTDVVISFLRYYYLRNLKRGYASTQEAVDAVLIFTINDGLSTCGVVSLAAICWLIMPNNFIQLGIYFSISKLYSNSLLATLNLRNWYRHRYAPRPLGLSVFHASPSNGPNVNEASSAKATPLTPISSALLRETQSNHDHDATRTEVFVDRQIEYNVADLMLRGSNLDTHSREMKSEGGRRISTLLV
ncbi:hypothetical protein BDP27DRAFT_1445971 [Rhodocollybia butyracea]|uniref:DUF6534 domain-containing protein n=1 Tax=Rhodocollybia butyracea TaxID=206335 RepID=A0A9P5PZB7_9AGAR|nr:hypothetical protein BDP27DRAFT_1445971 [Rhodocollybia butyracea]